MKNIKPNKKEPASAEKRKETIIMILQIASVIIITILLLAAINYLDSLNKVGVGR